MANEAEDVDTNWNPVDAPASIASIRNAVSFGLLVFLIGQGLMMGAFVVGHVPAWIVGILISIGGFTVSILSVNEALRRLDAKISSNARERLQRYSRPKRRRQRKRQD